ncbi:MAG: molybdopterin molybdotransferase MoeA, partial [bacterium]
MISVREALAFILNHITVGAETVIPTEKALGLVLAENVRAPNDIPPFTNSAMDGYAVRSADTAGASGRRPAILSLLETVPAGTVPKKRIGAGQATKIMTGAPLPRGADAVLIVEDSKEENGSVRCFAGVRRGENVRRAGEDVRRGVCVLSKGGMLGAMGRSRVRVIRRPRVAILATGSELIGVERTPGPGQVRNCNNLSLIGLVRKYGAEPVDMGLVRDNVRALKTRLIAAASCDLVVTSGGVSVGEYDVVKTILSEIGTCVRFWQVRIKPGKPLAFAMLRGTPLLGLPGNPVSVIVSFEQFVRPALLKMMGRSKLSKPVITARCERRIEKRPDRVHLIRARVWKREGRYHASPLRAQGSGILTSMVKADG